MQKNTKRIIDLEVHELMEIISGYIASNNKQISEKIKPDTSENLIEIDEASQIVHLSKSTIYGKTHNFTIPFFKPGKILLFDKKELTEWLRNRPVKTVSKLKIELNNSILGKSKVARG